MKLSLKHSGMTLIELMIVVGIISIIAAIAYPSYLEYVNRSKRSDGKNALVDVAARQERFRFGSNTYATAIAQLGIPAASPEGHYTVSITAANDQTFTARVTPGTTQVSDKCQSLTITNAGVKGTINTFSRTAAECWK